MERSFGEKLRVYYEAHYYVVCRIPRMCMCAARAMFSNTRAHGPEGILELMNQNNISRLITPLDRPSNALDN